MARRKKAATQEKNFEDSKNNSKNDIKANSAQEKTKKTANAAANRQGVSYATCFAGMFLTLVLGFYLGTILPEAMQGSNSVKTANVPANQKKQENTSFIDSIAKKNDDPHLPRLLELQELVKKEPTAENWTLLGDYYFDHQEPQKSIDAYTKALAINPKNPDAMTDMGVMYRELKNYGKALECFRNATAINPGHIPSMYNEGVVLAYDLGDKKKAAEVFEKILKLRPDAKSPSGVPLKKMIEELR